MRTMPDRLRSRRQSLACGSNFPSACRPALLRARDCPQLLAAVGPVSRASYHWPSPAINPIRSMCWQLFRSRRGCRYGYRLLVLHLFGETIRPSEKPKFARGMVVSIGAVRSHHPPRRPQAPPRRRPTRCGPGCGGAARWIARQTGPVARLSRRGRIRIRPEAKTPQTDRYHARFQRPDPRRTYATATSLEPANVIFFG